MVRLSRYLQQRNGCPHKTHQIVAYESISNQFRKTKSIKKTVAELTDKDTKVMVENVTKMWHILNFKTPSDGKRLNDEDIVPVSDINDPRLSFLTEIGDCFKSMESKYTDRVRTDNTRTALHLTLHCLVDMAKMFLIDKTFKYVLFGKFLSKENLGYIAKTVTEINIFATSKF